MPIHYVCLYSPGICFLCLLLGMNHRAIYVAIGTYVGKHFCMQGCIGSHVTGYLHLPGYKLLGMCTGLTMLGPVMLWWCIYVCYQTFHGMNIIKILLHKLDQISDSEQLVSWYAITSIKSAQHNGI